MFRGTLGVASGDLQVPGTILGKAGFTFTLSRLLGCPRLTFPAGACASNPRHRTDFEQRWGSAVGAVHGGAPRATTASLLEGE